MSASLRAMRCFQELALVSRAHVHALLLMLDVSIATGASGCSTEGLSGRAATVC